MQSLWLPAGTQWIGEVVSEEVVSVAGLINMVATIGLDSFHYPQGATNLEEGKWFI
jgi:hypothetical protein